MKIDKLMQFLQQKKKEGIEDISFSVALDGDKFPFLRGEVDDIKQFEEVSSDGVSLDIQVLAISNNDYEEDL